MAGSAHPDAMGPPKPGRTRTAPPEMPRTWWSAPRIRNYLLFDATGVIYLLVAFVAIDLIWALGGAQEAPLGWESALNRLSHPLYIAFHALALVSVIFVGVRFFSLFPKAQPRDTGLPMPPDSVIKGLLYLVWIGVTVVFSLILAGEIF
jgi:fumarate reductase subunit C